MKMAFLARCKCGALNRAESESQAVTYVMHNNGCSNDLSHWQDWITLTKAK